MNATLSFSLSNSSAPDTSTMKRVLLAATDSGLVQQLHGYVNREEDPVEFVVAGNRAELVSALHSGAFDICIVEDDPSFIAARSIASIAESIRPECQLVFIGEFESIDSLIDAAQSGVNSCISIRYFKEQLLPHAGLWNKLSVTLFSPEVILTLFDALSDTVLLQGDPNLLTTGADVDCTGPKYEPSEQVLTEREQHLLRLGSTGLVAREIAEAVFLSVHTVNTHFKNIYRKLEVKSRGDAIHRAREIGEI